MRTYTPKPGDINRQWHVIDATDVVLGRLASQTAILLRGKHKATFASHMDMGDFVIIINAEKVALTGAKLEQKRAYRHSGYPGGLTSVNYAELLESNPVRAVEKAIPGVLPKNSLAAQQLGKLKVYRGGSTAHGGELRGLPRFRSRPPRHPGRRGRAARKRPQPNADRLRRPCRSPAAAAAMEREREREREPTARATAEMPSRVAR